MRSGRLRSRGVVRGEVGESWAGVFYPVGAVWVPGGLLHLRLRIQRGSAEGHPLTDLADFITGSAFTPLRGVRGERADGDGDGEVCEGARGRCGGAARLRGDIPRNSGGSTFGAWDPGGR